jgi:transcriptional regulator with PAS, ATPase and Fis domain
VARVIHESSPRADSIFVPVNCAAIPESLLEAEMFGYERGAFTDARHAKPGLFHLAQHGTVLLDEVSLLSPVLQAKLLTAIEERTVRRLGATRDESVDMQIIAAASDDLATGRRLGRFREDLYGSP